MTSTYIWCYQTIIQVHWFYRKGDEFVSVHWSIFYSLVFLRSVACFEITVIPLPKIMKQMKHLSTEHVSSTILRSCDLVVVVLIAQSCPTLCDPMDCHPPGSSVHEIFQARILEWVAISFSRGSSQPRDRTWVSCTAGKFFTDWATRVLRSCDLPLI